MKTHFDSNSSSDKPKRAGKDVAAVATVVLMALTVLLWIPAAALFIGWVLSLVLGGLGLAVGFWTCVGIVFLTFVVLALIRGLVKK